jgi:hypothetical protein
MTFSVQSKKLVLGPTPIAMTAVPITTTKIQATLGVLGGATQFSAWRQLVLAQRESELHDNTGAFASPAVSFFRSSQPAQSRS